jgi:hypothetical protein
MRTALRGVFVVVLLLLARVAGAQVDLRVETDSIESAALAYAKSHLVSLPNRRIVFDSRVRSGHTFLRNRSLARSSVLADALGASVVDFGCDNRSPSCRAPDADIGLLLQPPAVHGSTVHMTVEIHTRTGMGTETYELARAGKGWHVTQIVNHRAT